MADLGFYFGKDADGAENKVGSSRLNMIFGRSASKDMALTEEEAPQNLGVELFAAIDDGNVNKVRALIRRGAHPDSRDAGGDTALMYAARENYEKMVDVLLVEGADPLLKNDKGLTALMYAASGGNLEIAKLIVQNYADKGLSDDSSPEAAERAREKGDYTLAAIIEQKRQSRLFNSRAKQRKKEKEKKEAESRNEHGNPVAEGLFSAFVGIAVLAHLGKVASKFQSFFTTGETAAEAPATTEETAATPTAAPAPAPAAPAPKLGSEV